jgi:enolase
MSATAIAHVHSWEVLDSRGNPTVACRLRLAGGVEATASVPSGASTGSHEAVELRDGGERYGGKGVLAACATVMGELAETVRGLDARDQRAVDLALRACDGSPDLARLGANAVLAVSVAVACAAAAAEGVPLYTRLGGGEAPLLPMPMVNVLSGGAHAAGAVDLQDFLVIPVGATSFGQAIEWAARVRRATEAEATRRELPGAALAADEGGLGLALGGNEAALELLLAGIERAGLEPGAEAAIAIDLAASRLLEEGRYRLAADGRTLHAEELTSLLAHWCKRYPIVSLEDALAEDDWDGWRAATETLGAIQLVGDDLFATNAARLDRGVESGIANAVLVKPNQAGTVSDAEAVLRQARAAGYATIVSARSGETEDSWLADLAVGWRAGQIKVGSTTRSERTAKWNRLLRIESEHAGRVDFAGWSASRPAA